MTPCPRNEKIISSAKDMAWCWDVEDVLADKNFYLILVMQHGTENDLHIAEKYFSKQDFIDAIETAPAGFFYAENWYRWREKLGLKKKRTPVRFPECERDEEDWWRGASRWEGLSKPDNKN